jgi:para-nitrobenzyl esterase
LGLAAGGRPTSGGGRPGARPGDILAALVSDWFFRVPAIRVAETRVAADAAGTWMYRFDWPEPEANGGLGAAHAVEIPYVFDTIDRPTARPLVGAHPSRAVADRVHRVWVDFITRGDPGWAPYAAGRRTTGLFAEDLTLVDDPAGDERALWEGIR